MDDSKIKTALNEAVKDISPSEDMLYSIKNLSVKEDMKMKKIRPIKAVLTCALAIGILSVGAIGAGKIVGVESHSSSLEEVKKFPTEEEVKKMAGFVPAYTEKLGEYEFESCRPVHSSDIDEDGIKADDYTGISFNYKTDKGILALDIDPKPMQQEAYDEKFDYKGKEIFYHSILYKFVPPDYALTDEDKKLQEKGELEISYGSQEVELENIQSLLWESGGKTYCLLDMDVQIDKGDFINMAKQVIDAE